MKKGNEIYVVLGTRAQFIKMAPLLFELKKQKKKYTLIYTAQHKENIKSILDEYNLKEPDIVMYKGEESNTPFKGLKWFIHMFYLALFKAKQYLPYKGVVLVHGDTFSTWLAALMGKRANCSVAHIESGLRSFNLFSPFPEEISRLITFFLSDIYFCSDNWAVNNLKKFKGKKIMIGANTMLDGVRFALLSGRKNVFNFEKKPFVLVSIHRYENIFKKRFTDEIIPLLERIANKHQLIITLHPTTRERLIKLNLYNSLKKNKNIILHKRFNFIDWISLCDKAEFVISDGGSNQEELSYLGVPTLLFRKETERKEGLGNNVVLSMFNHNIINSFIKNYNKYRVDSMVKKIFPSKSIVQFLLKEFF